MNEAKLHVANRIGRWAAICAVAGACAPAFGYMVTGGTITFRGALVAPQFMIASQSDGFVAQSDTRVDAMGTHVASVRFDPPPNSAPSADITLRAADGHATSAVDTRFVDGHGKRVAPAAGVFHVGAAGGVLSMRAKDSAPVTLVTNYN
jgi:hypothetical protein